LVSDIKGESETWVENRVLRRLVGSKRVEVTGD
jgi:hypothetical protein